MGMGLMSQRDLLDKAAECARAIAAAGEPARREVLAKLQELWINLANESESLSVDFLAKEIATIERVHAQVMGLSSKA